MKKNNPKDIFKYRKYFTTVLKKPFHLHQYQKGMYDDILQNIDMEIEKQDMNKPTDIIVTNDIINAIFATLPSDDENHNLNLELNNNITVDVISETIITDKTSEINSEYIDLTEKTIEALNEEMEKAILKATYAETSSTENIESNKTETETETEAVVVKTPVKKTAKKKVSENNDVDESKKANKTPAKKTTKKKVSKTDNSNTDLVEKTSKKTK